MKILHIGDIHLGCTLENLRRNKEISLVFKAIIDMIKVHEVKAVLLAGDIFDSGSPSNESQEIYYGFLVDLLLAGCTQVIIIAGNHDSPNFLEAPGPLLQKMNIHVVGSVDPDHPEKEIIPLYDPRTHALSAIVCAVPHLRERDVRMLTQEGETSEEKISALHKGIILHYARAAAMAQQLRDSQTTLPIIGMGHMYASGSTFASQDDPDKPVGTLDPVDLSSLADQFDYMALGHIHRPQSVKGNPAFCYAGSILPMDLQENMIVPRVVLLDTESIADPLSLPIPEHCFQKMRVIKGNMDELRTQLNAMLAAGVSVWVKPIYTGEEVLPNWIIDLRQEFRDTPIELLRAETQRKSKRCSAEEEIPEDSTLAKLTPEEVFLAHLEKKDLVSLPEQKETLLQLYRSAQAEVLDPSAGEEKPFSENTLSGNPVMQFRRLFIRNVNSLYGDNLIDFDAEDFSSGIFLISGDTGSGKSSILDAVCLALYGSTPRVPKISDTQDSVMSEGTSEMSAELTFSLGETLYRVLFRHTRTGGKAKKPFRTPEHKLFKDGREIALSGKKGTLNEIELLIGMNMTQFTRCVLLAQGSFDAFLKAGSADRSAILKSITGTEVYSRIGQKINEKFSAVKENYTLHSQLLNEITFLPPEELEAQKKLAGELESTFDILNGQIESCQNAENHFQMISQSIELLHQAQEKWNAAAAARKAASWKYTAFADGSRALQCQETFDIFCAKEKELSLLEKELILLREAEKTLSQENILASREKSDREKDLASTEKEYDQTQILLGEVKELDQAINTLLKQQQSRLSILQDLQNKQNRQDSIYQQACSHFEKVNTQAKSAREYMESRMQDKLLEQKRSTWELRRINLVKEETAAEEKKQSLAEEKESLEKLSILLQKLREEFQKTVIQYQEQEKLVRSLTENYSSLLGSKTLEEIHMAWASAGKLSAFFRNDVVRSDFLSPEKPCPLCGSKIHPYCDGSVQIPSEEANEYDKTAALLKQRLDDLDACEKSLNHNKLLLEKLSSLLREKENYIHVLEQDQEAKKVLYDKGYAALEKICAEVQQNARTLAGEIFDALQIPFTDHTRLPDEITERINRFQQAGKVCEMLSAEQLAMEQAKTVYQTVTGEISRQKIQEQTHLDTLTKELAAYRQTRMEKFGSRDVEQTRNVLNTKLEEARQTCMLARDKSVRIGEALARNKDSLEKLLHKKESLLTELAACRNDLDAVLQKYSFASADEFKRKRLTPEEFQKLNEELRSLDQEEKTTFALTGQRQSILKEQQAKLPADFDQAQNQTLLTTLLEQQKQVRDKLNQSQLLLLQDQQARTKYARSAQELEETRLLFNSWKILNDNFGSTIGPNGTDRFGRIAQGYTFRELLCYANANRLGSLREHFTLVSDEEDMLELNVIDHYRADQERTSRNLSGGESFEVSLALALGLSEMSACSQNARLGNVLLDEGFGTLDDKALESALELLMQLKNSGGKLVGIISHVEKLKEKIDAGIHVSSSGGMGTLTGSGVAAPGEIKALISPDQATTSSVKKRTAKSTAIKTIG